MKHAYCKGCRAPFIPTADDPDYCDFCVCFPELRMDRNRLNNPIRKIGQCHSYAARRKAQALARRKARRRRQAE